MTEGGADYDCMIDFRRSDEWWSFYGEDQDNGRQTDGRVRVIANHHYDIVGHYHANNGSSVCKVWGTDGALVHCAKLSFGRWPPPPPPSPPSALTQSIIMYVYPNTEHRTMAASVVE